MRCDIRSGNVNLKPTTRAYIEERLNRSLGRIKDRISHVTVRFDDINGPKGGADLRCHIEVHLVRSGMILADVVAGDLRTAIDEAADRAALRIIKELNRQREVRRHKNRIIALEEQTTA